MNVTGFLLCVIAIQTLTIVGMTIVQHIERKDLYNKVVCRNMSEYNNIKAVDRSNLSAGTKPF